LNRSYSDESEVVDYLQNHASEFLSGRLEPRKDGDAVDWNVSKADVTQFRQSIAGKIVVEHRFGYAVYSITYHRPACSESQTYTFKVTSNGFASLYGCCGI
jgi:hypothetical protein